MLLTLSGRGPGKKFFKTSDFFFFKIFKKMFFLEKKNPKIWVVYAQPVQKGLHGPTGIVKYMFLTRRNIGGVIQTLMCWSNVQNCGGHREMFRFTRPPLPPGGQETTRAHVLRPSGQTGTLGVCAPDTCRVERISSLCRFPLYCIVPRYLLLEWWLGDDTPTHFGQKFEDTKLRKNNILRLINAEYFTS